MIDSERIEALKEAIAGKITYFYLRNSPDLDLLKLIDEVVCIIEEWGEEIDS